MQLLSRTSAIIVLGGIVVLVGFFILRQRSEKQEEHPTQNTLTKTVSNGVGAEVTEEPTSTP